MIVEPIVVPTAADDLDDLAALLCDAVEHGASVSFLPPLSRPRARAFWEGSLPTVGTRGVTLVARDREHGGGSIMGCVQVHAAWQANQQHRGEIAKLLVHTAARRRGLGDALMAAAEGHARAQGLSLLTLDTAAGGAAETLYRKRGWTEAGQIPHYAVDARGQAIATVLFYKQL